MEIHLAFNRRPPAPSIPPQVQAYISKKGYTLQEYCGALWVHGEDDGEPFELEYSLFLAITKKYYVAELLKTGREEG